MYHVGEKVTVFDRAFVLHATVEQVNKNKQYTLIDEEGFILIAEASQDPVYAQGAALTVITDQTNRWTQSKKLPAAQRHPRHQTQNSRTLTCHRKYTRKMPRTSLREEACFA